jgi:cell shape-determining protein MreC
MSFHASPVPLHKKKKNPAKSTLLFLLLVLALIGIFYLLKNPVSSGFYAIKSLFVPTAPIDSAMVTLSPNVLNAELSALRQENAELQQLVGKRMMTDDAALAAQNETVASVLMRPPQTPFDSLVINAGSDEGIAVGDQVYAFTDFPIGQIAEVGSRTAVVRLFSAPGNRIEVLIGSTTTAVIAEGKGGGNFFLKLPKVTEIEKGDIVMRTYLPPEALSTIESVDSAQGEAYTYAYFKLPVNIHTIVYVIVKKNSAR